MLDASLDDLFAGVDPAALASIEATYRTDTAPGGSARAARARHRIEVRRAKSEATLRDILPPHVEDGESWHVISHGDVDSLSFVRHALADCGYADVLALSTWCMAKPDLEELARWLDAGTLDRLELYLGEIFPAQYGDEYELARTLADTYGARLTIARNHSKVALVGNYAADYFAVVESSANVNTNPRIEQSTLTRSRALFDFYLEFYRGLVSIDRATR